MFQNNVPSLFFKDGIEKINYGSFCQYFLELIEENKIYVKIVKVKK
jgi:hypothetical protein